MKRAEIKKWQTKLKRQKAYYRNQVIKLKNSIIDQPSLYNENVAQYHLLQHEFLEARSHIDFLLKDKCKDSKLKEAMEFFKKAEIKILIDRNISLQNRYNDLELAYNKLQFLKTTPIPYVVPSKRKQN